MGSAEFGEFRAQIGTARTRASRGLRNKRQSSVARANQKLHPKTATSRSEAERSEAELRSLFARDAPVHFLGRLEPEAFFVARRYIID